MARNANPLCVSNINPGGRSPSSSCFGNPYVSTNECRKCALTGIGCRFNHTHGWTNRPSRHGLLGASIPHRSFVIRLIRSTTQAKMSRDPPRGEFITGKSSALAAFGLDVAHQQCAVQLNRVGRDPFPCRKTTHRVWLCLHSHL